MKGFLKRYSEVAESSAWLKEQQSPAAFSASFALAEGRAPFYKGQAGLLNFTSKKNTAAELSPMKEHWQETLTPHAFYLESEYLSEATWNAFHELAHRSDGELKFFSEERGWLDGLQIGGASSGRLVPVQISLDQLMILLSLQRQESVDGMTPSARALYQNPHTRKKLREYYSLLDEKL